ncbi:MAG: hypothetical protein COV72_00475 [Candidatus Omnitrophica bacterium CG11_big_fil_rev_8_21_14_0_20_42_13]|uniref:Phage tail collar domain-containing protein n=1 Tax=Candidatus Ghiorseimicrobium undicola TaxID=1974746 RepID=A0A2H0M1Y5_9BACT|nr:MAG: hypothetical protein COV72_00475 [Candidatus Omnitrophica bacterium CG11_big_fil_rev_8_21_14_0_20_42_13]
MKRVFLILATVAVLFFMVTSAYTAVPRLIRFQGKVTDTQGAPLNGSYNITFRVYDAASGGALLWSETQSAIPVNNGVFTVLLGNVNPLNLAFDIPYWLSMEVNNDGEMSPRQQIASVGYAIRAEVADSISNVAVMPSGAIVLWRGAACPQGYNRVSELDGKFLVSGAAYNAAAGGSNTHDHGGVTGNHALTIAEMPAHTHGGSHYHLPQATGDMMAHTDWYATAQSSNTDSTGGNQGHSHTISSTDNRPEFATILLCEKE